MPDLAVWYAGRRVATLSQRRGRMSLAYTESAGPLGAPLISMAMPVASIRYGSREAGAFFHGLLPEGNARRVIAYDLGLDPGDDFELLAALGKDCAGALVIQPADQEPAEETAPSAAEVIGEEEIGRRLAGLEVYPLGVDERVRVSLAGQQSKLLLARRPDGRWALPVEGAISTHILKPAHPHLEGAVANEAFCMTLATEAGLEAARTSVASFSGMEVLISERYDRRYSPDGRVERVHQEDACQALSVLTVPPERKYQESGGPSLAQIAMLLDRWGEPGAKQSLLRAVAFNVLVGNADAHGKNFSFLHDPDRAIRLAPLYDIMSTVVLSHPAGPVSTTLALFVNDRHDINEVDVDDLVAEAARWGLTSAASRRIVGDLLERLPPAIDSASDTLSPPERLVEVIAGRVAQASCQVVQLPGVRPTGRNAGHPAVMSGVTRCSRCGRPLHSPESVREGVGPNCARKEAAKASAMPISGR